MQAQRSFVEFAASCSPVSNGFTSVQADYWVLTKLICCVVTLAGSFQETMGFWLTCREPMLPMGNTTESCSSNPLKPWCMFFEKPQMLLNGLLAQFCQTYRSS